MKKILVTGSNGQLGSAIRKLEKSFPGFQFVFTDIAELDLLDFAAVDEFVSKENISICLNCAAYTAVDKAEDEEKLALKVNVFSFTFRLIMFSTVKDFVPTLKQTKHHLTQFTDGVN